MEGAMATMQRKRENEVTDLRATVDRLLKVISHYMHSLCSSMLKGIYERDDYVFLHRKKERGMLLYRTEDTNAPVYAAVV